MTSTTARWNGFGNTGKIGEGIGIVPIVIVESPCFRRSGTRRPTSTPQTLSRSTANVPAQPPIESSPSTHNRIVRKAIVIWRLHG